MILKYKFADGHDEEIEVTEEFAVAYAAVDKQFCQNEEKFAWRKREREASFEKLRDENGFDVCDNAPSVEDIVVSDDFVARFMEVLTEKQRRIFRKLYMEGKPLRLVAAELQVSLFAVQKSMKYIWKKYLEFF